MGAVSGPRVYGTYLDEHGLRHDVSGVIDGTFSKKKGGWDSITTCGKYLTVEPDPNPEHFSTCLKCVSTRRTVTLRGGEPGVIRGQTADYVYIDEAQDFNMNPCGEVALSPVEQADLINTVGNTIIAGATRGNGGTR